MKKNGQISILAVISIGITIVLFTIGGYAAQNIRTDEKIGKSNEEIKAVSERAATLEADSKTIKEDLRTIKADIKELLKIVK